MAKAVMFARAPPKGLAASGSLRALCAALACAGCESVPDLVFVGDDASAGDAASASDARDEREATADDARAAPDATSPDASDASFLACPGSVPSGATSCCTNTPCVRESCAGGCADCVAAGCAPGEWCCPQYNGGGKYKSTTCGSARCP